MDSNEVIGPATLVALGGWVALVLAVDAAGRWLGLSLRMRLWWWALCQIVPALWLWDRSGYSLVALVFLAVVLPFSWAMGRAVLEGGEGERIRMHRIAEEMKNDNTMGGAS